MSLNKDSKLWKIDKVIKHSNKKRLEKLEKKSGNIDVQSSCVIIYDSNFPLPDLSQDSSRGLIFLPRKQKSEIN